MPWTKIPALTTKPGWDAKRWNPGEVRRARRRMLRGML